MEKEKLCLRCMRKIGDSNVCPYCKNESNDIQKAPYLPLKTVVGGKYLIGKLVGSNGDGSTYYAFDLQKKSPVTLREFYPKGFISRGDDNYCLVNIGKAASFIDAKSDFIELWSKLKQINGYSALAAVYDVFEDLGTAYAVSEYLGEGKQLREYLLDTPQGYISWDDARPLLMPVLSALSALHDAGILHMGISPTTLIVDKDGKIKLSGFSIADVRNEKNQLESELFDGYAAIEQYGFDGKKGPWTDIYAFAAVLYRTLIGSTPISAASRISNDKLMIPGKFAEQLPAYVINALVNALQILPDDRTRDIELFRNELSASPAAAGTAAEAYTTLATADAPVKKAIPEPVKIIDEEDDADEIEAAEESDSQPDSNKLKKSTIAAFVISVILCLGILAVVFFGFKGFSKNNKESTGTTSAVSSSGASTDAINTGVIEITVPDFKGKTVEEAKAIINDSVNFSQVLEYRTQYDESTEDPGVIIGQDIQANEVLTSATKRTITLYVSNGLKLPRNTINSQIIGKDAKTASDYLSGMGFKNIKTIQGNVATQSSDSLKVYSIVYSEKDGSNWSPIPNDGILSANYYVYLYYYGEYVEPSENEQSTPLTQTDSQIETPTEAQDEPDAATQSPAG